MADIFTKKKRSEVMSKVKHKDSKIEGDFVKKPGVQMVAKALDVPMEDLVK